MSAAPKGLVRLEVGIAFCDGIEAVEAGSHLVLGGPQGIQVSGTARGVDSAASLHYALERTALVLHVLLADFDELRNFVMALDQQHIDVRPCELHRGTDAHETVIDPDQIAYEREDEESYDQQCDHGRPRGTMAAIRCGNSRIMRAAPQRREHDSVTALAV